MSHLPCGRQTVDDDDLAAVAEALHADMAELSELARRHGLRVGLRVGPRVIEDACHALGASDRGVPVGAGASNAVVFSVRPSTPVPDDSAYSSHRAQPRLDLEATRAMVERVA